MDKPPFTLSNPEVRLSATLPCGCTLTHVDQSKATMLTFDMLHHAAARQAEQAAFWFATQATRHRCELVSAANPCGLAQKANAVPVRSW